MVPRALLIGLALLAGSASGQVRSGNPILDGWYADPEAHVFDGRYWIYPTYSARTTSRCSWMPSRRRTS